MSDELREECGVYGIFRDPEALRLTYQGLFSLQHRGQEAAGLAYLKDGDIVLHKGPGLVTEALRLRDLPQGVDTAIGHVRYSTQGPSTPDNVQPLLARTRFGPLALGHNGTLTNQRVLKEELEGHGAVFQSTSDSEVLAHLIAHAAAPTLTGAVEAAVRRLEGGFAYLVLTRSSMLGVRDPHGIRPLVLGELGGHFILASETCALDATGGRFIREVEPGEMVVVDEHGVQSIRLWDAADHPPAFCSFEMVYFARPDSVFRGVGVHDARRALGRELAREHPVQADVVVGVPDSSTPAAMGYSEVAGIPLDLGLVKNRYVGRTFIQPEAGMRESGVSAKLSAVRSVVRDRDIVLVDDSLVRGTTSRHIVQLLRQAGAKSVHMRIASPPYRRPCHYGIDTSRIEELAAARWDVEETRRRVGADSLQYLSEEGLERALGPGGWCMACFGRPYPVPVDVETEESHAARR
ncbi:MAG: amidophosphoribosyltransferase [Clostridia bacterium]